MPQNRMYQRRLTAGDYTRQVWIDLPARLGQQSLNGAAQRVHSPPRNRFFRGTGKSLDAFVNACKVVGLTTQCHAHGRYTGKDGTAPVQPVFIDDIDCSRGTAVDHAQTSAAVTPRARHRQPTVVAEGCRLRVAVRQSFDGVRRCNPFNSRTLARAPFGDPLCNRWRRDIARDHPIQRWSTLPGEIKRLVVFANAQIHQGPFLPARGFYS